MDEWLEDGGPAFPMPSGPRPILDETTHYNEGMSLRAYFAGKALEGLMANQFVVNFHLHEDWKLRGSHEDVADFCVAQADAMLKRLKK